MMTILMKSCMILNIISLIFSSKSPVKFMMSLIFTKLMIFYLIFEKSGESWFPLIMLMIAVGGIMVMMMIMASLSPNNNSGVSKYFMLPLALLMPSHFFGGEKNFYSVNQMKLMLEYNLNLSLMMLLMTFYFLSFMFIVTMSKAPLREMKCH